MDPPAQSARTNRLRRKEARAEALTKYKTLNRGIREFHLSDDPVKTQKLINEQLSSAKELYPVVKRKLDGTAVDARHMKELMIACHEASKRINVTSKPFELRRVIRKLRREANEEQGARMKNRRFFRRIAELCVNKFLCRAPSIMYFYGALREEDLMLKKRKICRRPREKLTESKTITAIEKDIEVDVQQDSTPKEVEYIYHQIENLAKDKEEGVPFFETLVDPSSFIQTVENIFHISFLVKEGKVGVKSDERKKAFLTYDSSPSREVERRAAAANKGNQSILSFSSTLR